MLRHLTDKQIMKYGAATIVLGVAGYYMYEAKKNMDEIERQE